MNRKQRNLYMLFFVILFAISAPVLILLANGYTFDSVGKVFVHNGAIIIKSTPKKVDLYLDNKKVSNKMLNLINNYYVVNNVRFGKHTLECKKNGYTSWKKEVDIHSGISTEFWNVILFPLKNNTLKNYLTKDIKRFYLSPREKNEIVLYKENNNQKIISLLNTKTSKESILYSDDKYDQLIPNNNENIEWSSNHKKLLIPVKETTFKNYIVIDADKLNQKENINLLDIFSKLNLSSLENDFSTKEKDTFENDIKNKNLNTTKKNNETKLETTNLSLPINKNISLKKSNIEIYQARWIFNSDHQILVLTKKHQLFFIDTENLAKSTILDQNVNSFDLAGDHIYYIKLIDNLIWDIKPNKINYKQPISIIHLEADNNSFLKMFAYDKLRIAIITSNKKLYLLNALKTNEQLPLVDIENNVKNIQFSDDGKKMLYWTNNTIWTYMLRKWDNQPRRSKGEKIFITNFSSEIKNPQWMETFENILFTNGNSVKSAELDNRDQINLIDVLRTNKSPSENEYLYDKDTGTLYFLDNLNDNKSKILHSVELIKHAGFLGFEK